MKNLIKYQVKKYGAVDYSTVQFSIRISQLGDFYQVSEGTERWIFHGFNNVWKYISKRGKK